MVKTHAPLTFMQARRAQHAKERDVAAVASAARQAGSMTRGERDALARKPVRVVSHHWAHGSRQPYTDPVKVQAKALRRATKTARRTQQRGR